MTVPPHCTGWHAYAQLRHVCTNKSVVFIITSLIILCSCRLYAEPNAPSVELTAYRAVQKGNRLYSSGDYQQAVQAYESAQPTETDAPILLYNRANALYRLNDFDRAADLYGQVSAQSKDMSLVTKAKFNLGNTHYRRALNLLNAQGQESPDLQKTLDQLVAAVTYFRQALDINPDDTDAAHNLAVVRLTMKDILDRIKKQAEQQERQEQNRELAEKIKKLLERQIEILQQTVAVPQDIPPGPTVEATEVQGECAKLSPRQQQLGQDTAAVRDEVNEMIEQAPPPQANPDPCTVDPAQTDRMIKQIVANELTNATQNQDNAVERLDRQEVAPAIEAETTAAEHLQRALEALGQPQQDQEQDDQQQDESQEDQQSQEDSQQDQEQPDQQKPQSDQQEQQPEQQPPQNVEMPDTTAQDILDKEKEREEQRRAIQSRGYEPVEKDW